MNPFLCQGALRRIGKHLFSHITGKPVGTITHVKFLASPWQSLNCFTHTSRCSHVPILCKYPRCLMKLFIRCAFLLIYLSPWPIKNILPNDILVVLETSEGTRLRSMTCFFVTNEIFRGTSFGLIWNLTKTLSGWCTNPSSSLSSTSRTSEQKKSDVFQL